MAIQTADDIFGVAKWIVDPTAGSGTHTTIASALTSASSGDTIFIRPGTYTENLTLKAGVNLTAFGSDSSLNGTGNVIISGNATLSTVGSVTISGIQLQTNSGNVITVSGSVASIVNLNNCYLNCTNSTGITYSSSSASSQVNLYQCTGDLGTTGIALFSDSSAGTLSILFCNFTNSGSSTTASTKSAGILTCRFCSFASAFTYSSSDTTSLFQNVNFKLDTINTTNITTSGTGTLSCQFCQFSAGTASALSVGVNTTCALRSCQITSSNTNAITGAGTIINTGLVFSGTSHLSNVTTQTGGAASGITQGTAPSAGFIGEQIRSTVASGSAISVSNNTPTNITNIALTAGIWDVSCICDYSNAAITGTNFTVSISTISATRATDGDSQVQTPTAPTSGSILSLTIPSYRLTLSTNTTVYLVAYALYTVGSLTAFGRISATRVG